MAILLPSANNVAVLVARQVSGSVASFVAEMNRTARALGMSHTTLLGHDGFVGTKTGSDEAAGGCLMSLAVWPTASGDRSLIGVVLGQRGDDLISAGLSSARQLVSRLAPNADRGHIENRIRAGNATPP